MLLDPFLESEPFETEQRMGPISGAGTGDGMHSKLATERARQAADDFPVPGFQTQPGHDAAKKTYQLCLQQRPKKASERSATVVL